MGMAIIMIILMVTVDIPIDITMVTGMTITIDDEIALWANDFGLEEGKLLNLRV